MLFAKQDDPRNHVIEERRAERTGPAHLGTRISPAPTRLTLPGRRSGRRRGRRRRYALAGAVEQLGAALVKKLCFTEPRMEIRTPRRPARSSSARESIAPAAGIGEDAPTATWPMPSSSRAMVKIRVSRAVASLTAPGFAEGVHVAVKTFLRAGGGRVARDFGRVLLVFAPQGVRPGAVLHLGDGADVERRQYAGGGGLVAQQGFSTMRSTVTRVTAEA